jgi:hypothetical protein
LLLSRKTPWLGAGATGSGVLVGVTGVTIEVVLGTTEELV